MNNSSSNNNNPRTEAIAHLSELRPRTEEEKQMRDINQLFKPVRLDPDPNSGVEGSKLGEEIAGKLSKQTLLRKLNGFYLKREIRMLAKEHGLDDYLYHQAYISFRKHCIDIGRLPTDLYVLLADLTRDKNSVDDIFPFFLKHARKVFPHLECLDDLRKVSDLTDPPNWYPEARSARRKVIFHAGPTNSGKTYHALERFKRAESAVYCGPLKLLAVEVFNKMNKMGVNCDLVTGEERKFADEVNQQPSSHVACTVEMTNVNQHYEVAVIDEIQMLKDYQRGWAWTRALLGISADEIHVCGEKAAVDLVREMMITTGEEVELRSYDRLTKLVIQDEALGSLERVEPGDCIVCFSKQDIYSVSRSLEQLGVDTAVIYGSLPPGTKLAMAERFNDPSDPCKVLVATDAVGMGLNLNIRRIIFYSMTKLQMTESGEKEMDVISVSQTLQIAGRAGRFNTQWETGYVTCFHQEEVALMKRQLSKIPEEILQAGLHPTYDQIETYAYHLPQATLTNLINIFVSLSTLDNSLYALCHLDDFKFLADIIEHIRMPLKAKYTFCCAPINRHSPFVCTMFLKVARQFSLGELVTFDWLSNHLGWPFSPPLTILDLVQLEAAHDVFDVYLWLSYRFPDMFPDVEVVRTVQKELDAIIEEGVSNIVQLLKHSDSGRSRSSSSPLSAARNDHNLLSRDKVESMARRITELGDKSTRSDDGRRRKRKQGKLTSQLISQGILTKKMLNDMNSHQNNNRK